MTICFLVLSMYFQNVFSVWLEKKSFCYTGFISRSQAQGNTLEVVLQTINCSKTKDTKTHLIFCEYLVAARLLSNYVNWNEEVFQMMDTRSIFLLFSFRSSCWRYHYSTIGTISHFLNKGVWEPPYYCNQERTFLRHLKHRSSENYPEVVSFLI